MKIAVVGAGLAGLSAAWHALQKGHEVTVFDEVGIGAGASGVSTGLLYPCPGREAIHSWRSLEGMAATRHLLKVAEEAYGSPVASYTGIFRPAESADQRRDFQENQSPEAVWCTVDVPGLVVREGLWIESGITVFSRPYLQGLWLACVRKGATMIKAHFSDEKGFDKVILATGAGSLAREECKNISFRTAIGQSLVCEWKRKLPFSIASYGYISVTEDPKLCQIGSTYEHTKEPDPKKAIDLIEKVATFYPEAREFKIQEIRAGKRIAPKEGHQPILAEVRPNTWLFTGLGSRGMLYHAMLGRVLLDLL
ncbi:MAG TPA: FAD-dependent oxidoreductase [Chlamydiales bacterium]|nr:FAD-dependent oxidoreductase [Chlamydiales bacterium]